MKVEVECPYCNGNYQVFNDQTQAYEFCDECKDEVLTLEFTEDNVREYFSRLGFSDSILFANQFKK